MRDDGIDRGAEARVPRWAWIMLACALAVRLAVLVLSPAELYPDEAQYWGWAQTPAPGYYSKPPLLAWLIALTTALFGDAEWAVRLSAPLCHAGAAAALMLLARDLYGRMAAGLAGALWLSMAAVSLSSLVISTDAPLLACWSVALLAFFRMIDGRSWRWAILFGTMTGAGLMAKYAMVYALIGVALAALFDAPTRRALMSRAGLGALLAGLVVIAPNLIWNARNGMATLRHTADNADWGASLIHPGELLTFWASQIGVFGPVLFPLTMAALVLVALGRLGRRERLLAAFIAPPLLIVSAQAFLAHAYANWAAAAFPAGVALCAGILARRRAWIAPALIGNLACALIVTVPLLVPRTADALGFANAFKQTRGWATATAAVMDAADRGGFATIVFDDRFGFHATDYYGRDRAERDAIRMWRRFDAPASHAETCCAPDPGDPGPFLLVARFGTAYAPWFAADFPGLTPAGEIVVPLGGGLERRLTLLRADEFAPVSPRDGAAPPR